MKQDDIRKMNSTSEAEPEPQPSIKHPEFLSDEELAPEAPFNVTWRERHPLEGFRIYLVQKVTCLTPSCRQLLHAALDRYGWPSHLQSIERANESIVPGSKWSNDDLATLKVCREMFGIPMKTVARIFFEGRIVNELHLKHGQIMDFNVRQMERSRSNHLTVKSDAGDQSMENDSFTMEEQGTESHSASINLTTQLAQIVELDKPHRSHESTPNDDANIKQENEQFGRSITVPHSDKTNQQLQQTDNFTRAVSTIGKVSVEKNCHDADIAKTE